MDLNNARFALYGLIIGITAGVIIAMQTRPKLFTEVKEVANTKYVVKYKVIYKTKDVVTIKKKEDLKHGTVETTTTTSFATQNIVAEGSTSSQTNNRVETKVGGNTPHYSLGLNNSFSNFDSNSFTLKGLNVELGVRVFETPFWLQGSYEYNKPMVGFRWEF